MILNYNVTYIVKDAVYGTDHDEAIRAASRACKCSDDLCEMGSIATALHAISEEIAAEQKLTIPAALQPPNSAASIAKDKAPDVELSISEQFCAKIRASTGQEDISDEALDVVRTHETMARRIMEANVTLLPIPKSEKKAKEEILKSAAGKIRGTQGVSAVGIFCDPGVLGEPITAPHNRICPIPVNDVKALARLPLAACPMPD